MNKEELNKTINENFRVVFMTIICCSIFWIAISTLFYTYIVNERTPSNDSEIQMMSGFYKRDVKIKMDSITNALIIQTLRNQLVEKQVEIDSLEKAYMDSAEKLNRLHRNDYESDERRMMFMNQRNPV
jgi:hypothetical protein